MTDECSTATATRGRRALTGHRLGEWHHNARHSDALVAKARALREQGLSYKEISAVIDVNWPGIFR